MYYSLICYASGLVLTKMWEIMHLVHTVLALKTCADLWAVKQSESVHTPRPSVQHVKGSVGMKWNRVKASFSCVSGICLYTTYRMLRELQTAHRAVFTVPRVPGTKNKTAQQIISGIPSDISRQQHGARLPNRSKNYHEGSWSRSFCRSLLHLREEPADDITQDAVKLRDSLSGKC